MFTARGLMCDEDQIKLRLKHVVLQGHLGIQDGAVRNFLRCCPHIEHLELLEFFHSTDECLYAVAEHLPLLHTLVIYKLRAVTDAGVSAIRNACPRIRHFELISGDQVQNKCLSQGPAGVLEHLSIYAIRITDDTLIRCAQHNYSLRVLRIYVWNMEVEGLGIGFRLSADTLNRMVSCLPQLEEFSFNSTHESQIYCNDGTLQALATFCPQLKILKLPQGNLLTNAGLEKLGLLRCLQEIQMINCPNLANSALCAIAQGCPELTTINMSSCKFVTSVGIYALGRHCRKLQVLGALSCGWIRDYALIEVLDNAPDLRRLDVDHGLLRGAAVIARIGRLESALS